MQQAKLLAICKGLGERQKLSSKQRGTVQHQCWWATGPDIQHQWRMCPWHISGDSIGRDWAWDVVSDSFTGLWRMGSSLVWGVWWSRCCLSKDLQKEVCRLLIVKESKWYISRVPTEVRAWAWGRGMSRGCAGWSSAWGLPWGKLLKFMTSGSRRNVVAPSCTDWIQRVGIEPL